MLSWQPDFATGHPDIDREHREICESLNDIERALAAGAGREQIADMVAVLQRYTLVHFHHEEGVMACVGCPRHRDNCVAHAAFAARLERWLDILTTPGVSLTILKDVHAESCRWIQQHIMHVDSGLRQSTPALSEAGVGHGT